jgi:hypothetical protein
MEHCKGETLRDYLDNKNYKVDRKEICDIFK